jgi:uncharacterized protein
MRVVLVFLMSLIILSARPALAEDLTDAKKKLIDEFLVLTGGDRMADIFARYYIEEIGMNMLKTNPDLDEKAFRIIAEEVNKVIKDEVTRNNAISELSYPIYHKHLTTEDIVELIRFYKSPIGQKTMQLLPTISREAMQAGESWGRALGPGIQQKVNQRLEQESIKIR